MMEPEQRTEREITYQVGWKRGKIALKQDKTAVSSDDGTYPEHGGALIDRLFQWSVRYVWKPAGAIPDKVLKTMLIVFPLIAFALSLWLVYRLSIQPY